jgi:hypothetical protein
MNDGFRPEIDNQGNYYSLYRNLYLKLYNTSDKVDLNLQDIYFLFKDIEATLDTCDKDKILRFVWLSRFEIIKMKKLLSDTIYLNNSQRVECEI